MVSGHVAGLQVGTSGGRARPIPARSGRYPWRSDRRRRRGRGMGWVDADAPWPSTGLVGHHSRNRATGFLFYFISLYYLYDDATCRPVTSFFFYLSLLITSARHDAPRERCRSSCETLGGSNIADVKRPARDRANTHKPNPLAKARAPLVGWLHGQSRHSRSLISISSSEPQPIYPPNPAKLPSRVCRCSSQTKST